MRASCRLTFPMRHLNLPIIAAFARSLLYRIDQGRTAGTFRDTGHICSRSRADQPRSKLQALLAH